MQQNTKYYKPRRAEQTSISSSVSVCAQGFMPRSGSGNNLTTNHPFNRVSHDFTQYRATAAAATSTATTTTTTTTPIQQPLF